jgi:hypothetical protein
MAAAVNSEAVALFFTITTVGKYSTIRSFTDVVAVDGLSISALRKYLEKNSLELNAAIAIKKQTS